MPAPNQTVASLAPRSYRGLATTKRRPTGHEGTVETPPHAPRLSRRNAMFRRIVSGVTLGVATCAVLGLIDGCLTRPVVAGNPVTKTNFITSIPQGSIDKVDLLFDIDNSASMGDKQAYLAQAVPDLITRLVTPNCVNSTGTVTGSASTSGMCTDPASTPEFPPVHNL